MSLIVHPVTIFGDIDSEIAEDLMWDCNTVLWKNTQREFNLVDVKPRTKKPGDGQVSWRLDQTDFPVWIELRQSKPGKAGEWKSSAGCDSSGVGICWDIGYSGCPDWTWTVRATLHEFGHLFGAYSGFLPEADSLLRHGPYSAFYDNGLWNCHDPYWGDMDEPWRAEFEFDPMARFVPVSQMKYSSLTAAIINGDYRWLHRPPPCNNTWDRSFPNDLPFTKLDDLYQRLVLGRLQTDYNPHLYSPKLRPLSANRIDDTTVDWVINTMTGGKLIMTANGRDYVMQEYPRGCWKYRVWNAGNLQESNWRVE